MTWPSTASSNPAAPVISTSSVAPSTRAPVNSANSKSLIPTILSILLNPVILSKYHLHIIDTGSISKLIARKFIPPQQTFLSAASATSRRCLRLRDFISS